MRLSPPKKTWFVYVHILSRQCQGRQQLLSVYNAHEPLTFVKVNLYCILVPAFGFYGTLCTIYYIISLFWIYIRSTHIKDLFSLLHRPTCVHWIQSPKKRRKRKKKEKIIVIHCTWHLNPQNKQIYSMERMEKQAT